MAGLELLFSSVQAQLVSAQDAVVLSLHWAAVRAGLKVIGIGDEPPADVSSIKRSELLPAGWNTAQDVYTLQYVGPGDKVYLLKAIRMDNILLVHLMRVSDETVADMMIEVNKYTSEDLSSFDSAYNNIDELSTMFTSDVLDKVLKSPASTETRTAPSGSEAPQSCRESRSSEQGKRDPLIDDDPLRVGPRRPIGRQPPDWADPGDPFSIGRGDLDPLAGGIGGGMVFDPMRSGFPGRGRDPNVGLPGPGRLPPGAVPPGARFDPFGPPDPDRSGAPRGGRGPAGPDPDHLPPPGFDDMFM